MVQRVCVPGRPDGMRRSRRTTADAGLLVDVLDVVPDRLRGDAEILGDLLVRLAAHEDEQDLELALGRPEGSSRGRRCPCNPKRDGGGRRDREFFHEPYRLSETPRLVEVDSAPDAETDRRGKRAKDDALSRAMSALLPPICERSDDPHLHRNTENEKAEL